MANKSTQLDHVFGALSDPTRRAIVARLCEGEASVGDLARPFEMALPSLMKHIRVLELSGLVETAKSGRIRTCRIRPQAIESAEQWMAHQRAVWEARLDRLDAYVRELNRKSKQKNRNA
jgi:DNA-binding transcriptional ArsR family regulator